MLRFKFTFDKNKVVPWLNDMSAKGWAATRQIGPFFFFDQCTPDEYRYEADVSDRPFRVSEAYRALLGDFKIDVVNVWGPWVLLRKKAVDGPFELYTDVPSRIAQHSRILRFFKCMCLLEVMCCAMLLVSFASEPEWLSGTFALFAALVAVALGVHAVEVRRQMALLKTGTLPVRTPIWRGLIVCAAGLTILGAGNLFAAGSAPNTFMQGAGIGLVASGVIWSVCHFRDI